ncbi:TQO small subunit DoxD [Martelella alba]|uniref:Quinol oxidase n=1 Tax=Martelella alba TaxID=2590451 RepID=A0ABY2SPB7_9HYPH|nr:TQO small subunit DoxD [Martelella alba]TKI07808.1 quinol oxidase [Martelella alba]
MLTETTDRTSPRSAVAPADSWSLAAFILLGLRFAQGFIYWGGGSRRFIYAPAKLDPHAANWMANKFQGAMPGAILGTGYIVDFLLRHFTLLYISIIVFSLIELVAGVFLMFGFFTRLAALGTLGLSAVLMMLYGWQGATCIDEWTMAACNFAMGTALLLGGSSAFSLDARWMRRNPAITHKPWFRWLASGPFPEAAFRKFSLCLAAVTVVFIVATYNYYRGSVLTPYHAGPTSPSIHHLSISDAGIGDNGNLSFTVYLDGGTPDVPAHIVRIRLLGANGSVLETWSAADLAKLPASAIVNDYAYNKFKPALLSLAAGMGARAHITLPPTAGATVRPPSGAVIELQTIDNRIFTAPLG